MKSLHTTARDLPPLSATRETPCIAMKMQGSQECMKKENSILKRLWKSKSVLWVSSMYMCY